MTTDTPTPPAPPEQPGASERADRLLALLAHELRDSLAPMRSSIAVLQQDAAGPVAHAQAKAMLGRQLRRLSGIVDGLFDAPRIARGHVPLDKRRLDLVALVREGADSVRSLCDARQHLLTVTLPEGPLEVAGDPVRLAQLVSQLLTNAAKYTKPGGLISVSVARDGPAAVITVRDNGQGIPADQLPAIFDLFMKEPFSTRRSQGGLGIGLTLVRQIAEAHGGTVQAQSAGVDQGSEFTVRLPLLARAEEAAELAPAAAPGEFTPRRILVVDDNVDTATMCALVLKLEGHEIRTAYDGPSALTAAREFSPEIVLLDIGLPGMNGYDVARRLRERDETRTAQIAALSGYDRDFDRQLSAAAGFDFHLVKPAALAQIHEVIAACRGGDK